MGGVSLPIVSPSRTLLHALSRQVQGILSPGAPPEDVERGDPVAPALATGWALGKGRLRRGAIHEWFGADTAGARSDWTPPLAVLTHLARRALLASEAMAEREAVLWIGRRVWPYPCTLLGDFEVRDVASGERFATLELERVVSPAASALFARSLFVDPPDASQRLWAIDAALRCPSVAAVVGDASTFDMASTRRLQLAAEAGKGLGLLVRPPRDEGELSAAATRWRIRRALPVEGNARPRWTLELLRCKGALGYGGQRSEGDGSMVCAAP